MPTKPRFLPLVPVIAMAVTLALSSCGQNQQGAMPKAGPAEVGVVTLQPQRAAITRELPARVSAFTVAEIRPQVGGIILKRLFTEGSEVKRGQVLYQINPETYQAAYQTAAANPAKAQANLTAAELKAKRYSELVEIKAISKQDNDDAQSALLQARASVASSKADLETARINLSYTRIVSPVSGRIGKSSVTAGALVTANQATALATVQQLSTVYVDMTQSSAEMTRLRRDFANGALKGAGSKAQVKLILEDGSEYSKPGVLEFADVTVDASTGMVTLRAVFPNPAGELLPGMFVRARLEQGVRDNALLVPQQAVSRTPKGEPTVMVVGADNKVAARVIKASQTVGDKWLVDGGLKSGERVVVEGLQKIQEGAVVKVAPAKPAASAAH
ncbi:efflux RND transporter periplasmic adaptor subunit [Paludibacterium denitrificans]|uniref:Efflux RND transporter periplasmic adaptor subunit n=1 Tax=Paludibacterium denitrificans TaxID=2675226 RepID=A0A844GE21_9NEIS|nr:efflux RND transporter periplasmic adaptor subunit [Paludibacterium denitrificans]MTD33167.1 efflux RND transporter periplasmic adaptor subunit [Paludibacterium denitrificans]